MPIRTLNATVGEGKFERVYTAGAGDTEVQVHSGVLPGQGQGTSTYNFYVSGDEEGPGLLCVNGEFTTDVEEGDELWVRSAEGTGVWTEGGMPVTLLIRQSNKNRDGGQGQGGARKEDS